MENKYPEVSVIVANHNGMKYLEDCFSSLMKMDYPRELLEYILVDNGSTDESINYMKIKFPFVRILSNSQNRGFAEANNQGAKAAKGKVLALLNNDMKVHPLWLKKLLDKFLQSSEDLACVSSKILNYDGDKIDFIGGGFTPFGTSFQVDFGKSVKQIGGDSQDEEKELLFACGGAMAIKKEVFLNCRGFDEDYFAFLEDVDLGWRLRLMGYRVVYEPKSIAFHKHGSTAKRIPSHQLEFMFERNRLRTIIKNTEDTYLPYFLSMVMMENINKTFGSSMNNLLEFYFPRSNKEELPSRTKNSEHISLSFGKKLRLMWEKKDLGMFGRWLIRKNNRWIAYITGYELVPRKTLSFSAAFNSIIPELSSLILKRKEIQSKRKISDRQIFPLFMMDEYQKQAIAKDSVLAIERIMEFEKQIMKENKIHFPE